MMNLFNNKKADELLSFYVFIFVIFIIVTILIIIFGG